MTLELVQRYRPLLGEAWPAFTEALAAPLPQCVQVNTVRLDGERLAALFADAGERAEPLGWTPAALRLPAAARPGRHWGYRAGLFGIQEEASLLPVVLLAPAPGHSVLDLCAAPGGKTARIALALGNRGTVVANDVSTDRIAAIGDAVRRLGLLNVSVSVHDGARYPARDGRFDRVLVDAPCSSEGTVRKFVGGGRLRVPKGDFRRWVGGVQRALLRRAVALTRPGGRVVYSTCTFAPEENEAVVADLLAEFGDGLRVAATPLTGLATAPGLARFDGREFPPALRHAHRLWPHRSGTGGFFAVALERTGGSAHDEAPRAPEQPLQPDLTSWLQRFGLAAEVFAGLCFHRQGRFVRAVADDHQPPRRVRIVHAGIAFERFGVAHRKLSTTAALLFGDRATRNVVEVSAAGLAAYRRREVRPVARSALRACDGGGHVLVRHRGFAVGVAQLGRGDSTPVLASLYPKDWSRTEPPAAS